MGWKRANECGLCGKNRCAVATENERMGYCFRFSKTYFVRPDGSVSYAGQAGNPMLGRKAKAQSNDQTKFDFGEDKPDQNAILL